MSLYGQQDFDDWSSCPSRRQSTISTSTVSSASTSILFQSPATSPGSRKPSWQLYDDVVRTANCSNYDTAILMCARIHRERCDVSSWGEVSGNRRLLFMPVSTSHAATKLTLCSSWHQITRAASRTPKDSAEYPLRVSFLENQTIQTSQVVFMTQLSYKFENWEDCVSFQELLLCSKLIFIGGMAEAKSKGRGEECISQNLRILRGPNGKRVMLYFANSQRKDLKRYVSIPLNCVAHVKPPKKSGRPVAVDLNPNFDYLAQMRNLHIQFLDDNDSQSFCQLLSTDLTIG
ncbi:hypothetical protein N7470_004663 [Penicillium chermesinum]|nr:hypothetical protein N7470_004663 [Penicillium chermesinum]